MASTVKATFEEAITESKERLQAIYGDRLVRAILYGSHARGDASPDSDVDVLVVLRSPINIYAEYKRLSELWAVLFERYRLDFSFHPYDEETYQDLRRPFLRNVHAEGVELLEVS